MAIQIQVRRDSSENWLNNNPILAEGECGLELDTHKFKFGDGINLWNDLPYAVSNSSEEGTETFALEDYINTNTNSNCANFNGTYHAVNTTKTIDELGINYNNVYSIACTINIPILNSNKTILGAQGDGSENNRGLKFYATSDGRLIFEIIQGSTSLERKWQSATNILKANENAQVILIYQSTPNISSNCLLFVNGESKELTYIETGASITGTINSDVSKVGIGCLNYDNNPTNFFSGKMFNFAIYPKALTLEEITNVANQEILSDATICLPMAEGLGDMLFDISGNKNNCVVEDYSDDFWGSQDIFHYNLENGHTILSYFNGTDNQINIIDPNSHLSFGTEDYEISFSFCTFGNTNSFFYLMSTDSLYNNNFWSFAISPENYLNFYRYSTVSSTECDLTNTLIKVKDGKWHSVVARRENLDLKLIVDEDESINFHLADEENYQAPFKDLIIGGQNSDPSTHFPGTKFKGAIRDLIIKKGDTVILSLDNETLLNQTSHEYSITELGTIKKELRIPSLLNSDIDVSNKTTVNPILHDGSVKNNCETIIHTTYRNDCYNFKQIKINNQEIDDFIGSQISNSIIPDPTQDSDIANKGYVDTTVENALENVSTPTQNAEAANKEYVDTTIEDALDNVSAPTQNAEAANKEYVDTTIENTVNNIPTDNVAGDYSDCIKTGGHCITFDGTSNYIDTGKNLADLNMDWNQPYTFFCSVKLLSKDRTQYLFGTRGDASVNNRGSFFYILNSDNSINFLTRERTTDKIRRWDSAPSLFTTNTVYNILLIYKGNPNVSDGIEIYINGEKITLNYLTTGSDINGTVSSPTTLGCMCALDEVGVISNLFFHCELYNYSIYPKAVNSKEFNLLNNNKLLESPTLSYPLAENIGNIVFDVSGNKNHQLIKGTTTNIWGTTQDNFHYNNDYGFNRRIFFDGNSYISLSNGGGIGSTFIIAVSFLSLNISSAQKFLNYRPTGGDGNEIRFEISGSKIKMTAIHSSGSGTGYKQYSCNTTLKSNTVYKAIMVWDNSNLKGYLKESGGAFYEDVPYTKAMDSSVSMTDTTRIRRIGAGTNNGEKFNGYLWDLKITSYSEDKLNTLLNNEDLIEYDSHFKLNETEETTIYNSSNENDNGTFNGNFHSSYIPSQLNEEQDVLLYELENPAIANGLAENNSETTILTTRNNTKYSFKNIEVLDDINVKGQIKINDVDINDPGTLSKVAYLEGINNFEELPTSSASMPLSNNQLSNKYYVDAVVTSAITNVPTPVDNYNAVHKLYVDEAINNLEIPESESEYESNFQINATGSNAIKLSGNEYVDTKKTIAELGIDYDKEYTIALYFKLSDLSNNPIIFGAHGDAPDNQHYIIDVLSTGEFRIRYQHDTTTNSTYKTVAGRILPDIYYKIYIVSNGNYLQDSIRLYINNVLVTLSYDVHSISDSVSSTSLTAWIGGLNFRGSLLCGMNGEFLHFGIYNRQLTYYEIYNSYYDLPNAEPIVFYPFCEGIGRTTYDTSGNNFHGELITSDLGTARSARQDRFHYNLLKGNSLCGYFWGGTIPGHVEVTYNTDFSFAAENFSIDCEIILHTFTNAIIVSKWDKSNNGQKNWDFRIMDSTRIMFYSSHNGTTTSQNSFTVPELSLNTKIHIALIKEGTNITLYLNKVLIQTQSLSHTIYTTSQNVQIGKYTSGDTTILEGIIRKLRFTKGVLEPEEKDNIINNIEYLGGHLKAYFLNKGTSDYYWQDFSNNNNDGTVTGIMLGTYIPALYNGNLDASGSELLNKSLGKGTIKNNCESTCLPVIKGNKVSINGQYGSNIENPRTDFHSVGTSYNGINGIYTATQYHTSPTWPGGSFITERARGSEEAPEAILQDDNIGYIGMKAHIGESFQEAFYIMTFATENWSNGARGCETQFVKSKTGGQAYASTVIKIDDNNEIEITTKLTLPELTTTILNILDSLTVTNDITTDILNSTSITTDELKIGESTTSDKAALDVNSTTKGFRLPRMTTTQRIAITGTQEEMEGLMVFDTDLGSFCGHDGIAWTIFN